MLRAPDAAQRGALCGVVRCQAGAHVSLGPGSAEQRKSAAPRPGHELDEAHHSSGQGSTIFQSSSPFLIFFISVVSPPLRRIHSFTVSG
jgi:hypothetical protein